MSEMNFRKTALSKQGSFKPAKKDCVVVKPTGKGKENGKNSIKKTKK